MNHRKLSAILLALLAAVFSDVTTCLAGNDPAEPLNRRVGTWSRKVTFKKAEWTPEERTITGDETVQWVLDKKFLQGSAVVNEDGIKAHWLMNYDPEAKVYRVWYFDSRNAFPRGDTLARWEAATKTMHVTADVGNGFRGTGALKHLSDDELEWSFAIRDGTGRLMQDTLAVMKRKK